MQGNSTPIDKQVDVGIHLDIPHSHPSHPKEVDCPFSITTTSPAMSLPVDTIIWLYSYLLAPVPILAQIGFPLSAIDVLGTLRLALAVQQIKYSLKLREIENVGQSKRTEDKSPVAMRFRADTHLSSIWAMFVIVYGGELFVCQFTNSNIWCKLMGIYGHHSLVHLPTSIVLHRTDWSGRPGTGSLYHGGTPPIRAFPPPPSTFTKMGGPSLDCGRIHSFHASLFNKPVNHCQTPFFHDRRFRYGLTPHIYCTSPIVYCFPLITDTQ